MKRYLTPLIAIGASLVFALSLSEIGLRLMAGHGSAALNELARLDPMAIKVVPHGTFGYRQRPGAVFEYPAGRHATANSAGYRGPVVARPKPPGVFRVVLLGGSTSHGYGVNDDETIDAYLREILRVRDPARSIEVVNLAFDGYDAYQDWQRTLTDGVPLDPDVIIVNNGINDVRNARFAPPLGDPDPRTLLWDDDMRRLRREAVTGPTLWTRVKHWFYVARLPGYVRGLRLQKKETSGAIRAYPEAADNFERNVLRIVAAAAQVRAHVILSTPPSVILDPHAPADMQPRSYWLATPKATQDYRDTLDARLRGLATRLSAEGKPVVYVPHHLSADKFLDDCHLTPAGNQAMAADFASALAPMLGSR